MKKLFYVLAFILIAISVFFNVSAYAGGAGGSWGDDSGFGGNGGSTGGGGGGGSWDDRMCTAAYSGMDQVTKKSPKQVGIDTCAFFNKGTFTGITDGTTTPSIYCRKSPTEPETFAGVANCTTGENPQPECPADMHWDGSNCVKDLKCPAGYVKSGNSCIWQCPAGFKMVGGNCVKDDQPEDCDPTIQQCDEDGAPVCDPCSKLQQLINNNLTMINNDNRVISLTENIVTTITRLTIILITSIPA